MAATISIDQPLWITGTDTDVGKTWVTALMAAYYLSLGEAVHVWKPVQTGVTSLEQTDPAQVAQWLGEPPSLSWSVGAIFEPPAAPSVADLHQTLSLDQLFQDFQSLQQPGRRLLIEGAGGALVPLNSQWLLADWMATTQATALVVTRPNLGTINHTLLTVEALKQRDIPIIGVLINEAFPLTPQARDSVAVATVAQQMQHWLGEIPLLGWLPHQAETQTGCLSLDGPQLTQLFRRLDCNHL